MKLKRFFFFLGLWFLYSHKVIYALSVTPSSSSPQEIADFVAQRSDLIVVGELGDSFAALGTYPRMSPEQTIITEWEVTVETVLKGKLHDQVISLVIPVGCIPEKNICADSDAFPKLKQGERMLLFLEPMGDGRWFVFDIMHGFQWEKEGKFRPLDLTLQEIKNIIDGGTAR